MKKRFNRLFAGITCVFAAMLMMILPVDTHADTYQDGTYTVGYTCKGGSGRGGVRGVEALVEGGALTTLYITMSSANYDYCYDPVSGTRIEAPAGDGNSVFTVTYPGTSFSFTADTTAMSVPHEITYTVTLDISGIPVIQSSGPSAPSGNNAAEPSSGSEEQDSGNQGSEDQGSGAQSPATSERQTPDSVKPGDAAETDTKTVEEQPSETGDKSKTAGGSAAKNDAGKDTTKGAENTAEKKNFIHIGAIIPIACTVAAAIIAVAVIIRKKTGEGK